MPSRTARLRCEALEDRLTPAAFSAAEAFPGYAGPVTVVESGTNLFATALVGGHVKVFDDATGTEVRSFLAYPGSAGTVQVVAGFFGASGALGVATMAEAGGHVKVFDGTGEERQSFLAYPGYDGPVTLNVSPSGAGASPAAPAVPPDGLVTAAAANGHVKLFDSQTGVAAASYLALPGSTAGPVRAAAGDLNSDGFPDLVVSGPDGRVVALDGRTGAGLQALEAYPGYAGPTGVTAGFASIPVGPNLTNTHPAIITQAANGHVETFDALTGQLLSSEVDADRVPADPNAPVFLGGSYTSYSGSYAAGGRA